MELNRRQRRLLRLQSGQFLLLFFAVMGVAAWLSQHHNLELDWTASGRHTLNPATVELLQQLEQPPHLVVFARDSAGSGMRTRIEPLLSRYQRQRPDLVIEYVDPDLAPQRVRALNITLDGEVVVQYGGRSENLKNVGEEALTNALQRLARGGERQLIFLAGHGERDPFGDGNSDLSEWRRQLTEKGFISSVQRLADTPQIPADTTAVVVADPQRPWLPGEVALLRDYLDAGGNLLWLSEGAAEDNLTAIADALAVERLPGQVVDATGQLLGIEHPALIVITHYPQHAITDSLNTLTLLPFAAPLAVRDGSAWEASPLLQTQPRAWAEQGELAGTVRFDEGVDQSGPLTVGFALQRPRPSADEPTTDTSPDNRNSAGETPTTAVAEALPVSDTPPPTTAHQRVVVMGDADFISNAYLGNGANADLGYRIVNWLSDDDSLITITHQAAPDTQIQLDATLASLLGTLFLLLLPGGLIGAGIAIGWRRRRR